MTGQPRGPLTVANTIAQGKDNGDFLLRRDQKRKNKTGGNIGGRRTC